MNGWYAHVRDAFRTRLWPLPTIAVTLALLLGLMVPELDEAIDDDLTGLLGNWLFGGDAEAARSLLSAIASSMITVTALTFSLTVVTLQLASSQFSPRLLRTFTRDLFVQVTLALFLATFTYTLTVLRAVRGPADEVGVELVPKIAVSLAFVLTVASVLGLVLFLAHLAGQIRVETMLNGVHRDASATMRAVLSERGSGASGREPVPDPPAGARPLLAVDDGFLVRVDDAGLLALAVEEEVLIRVDVHPGSFLVRGTSVGSVWSTGAEPVVGDRGDRVTDRVARCLRVGFERTSAQDVGFGLRQLTDVANKALSPGVNDPTTAIHALGHISAFLCALCEWELGPEVLRDDQDRARVFLHRPDLAGYVDLGLSQPRRYGATDPQVLEAVAQALLELSQRVPTEQRPVVRAQLERLRATVADQGFDAAERAGIDDLDARIQRSLDAGGVDAGVPQRGTPRTGRPG